MDEWELYGKGRQWRQGRQRKYCRRNYEELHSLGIDTKKKKANQNDKEELEGLVDNVKQSMIQDYKTAYSKNGDKHKDEAKSTVNL